MTTTAVSTIPRYNWKKTKRDEVKQMSAWAAGGTGYGFCQNNITVPTCYLQLQFSVRM